MSKGQIYPAESSTYQDKQSGARMRQITNHPSIHHHPFYYIPAYDDAMQRLIFISHRSGRPEIYAELRASGQLIQLTEHIDLVEWSISPSHDGRYVYFTDHSGAWRVNTESFQEEQLISFEAAAMREKGMVAAAMGTTALSYDDRYWAVPVRVGPTTRLVIIDTTTAQHQVILEHTSIGHPEFHPDNANLLRYAGPYYERMWIINRDGSNNRLAYQRDAAAKEWIVHETWRPGSRELLSTQWPHGVLSVNIDTGISRKICSFNAWHPAVNRQGTQMVADTHFPDWGLQLFNIEGNDKPQTLCLSNSTNEGTHWNIDHCPYDDGPTKVYAPQHTHPHPHFAPDGSCIVFTSDKSGHAQLYECILEKF